jgi:hypothetical protein
MYTWIYISAIIILSVVIKGSPPVFMGSRVGLMHRKSNAYLLTLKQSLSITLIQCHFDYSLIPSGMLVYLKS